MNQSQPLMMLLGENGIKILQSLVNGPLDISSIRMLTGLPLACIRTRIPVLINLGLVKDLDSGIGLNSRGKEFLQFVKASGLPLF